MPTSGLLPSPPALEPSSPSSSPASSASVGPPSRVASRRISPAPRLAPSCCACVRRASTCERR
eukprot:7292126-Alexandrium_andersonii.AAC.1